MAKENSILKILDINVYEKKRVILLILQSFFLGVYISYFFSFANGIFLSKFEIEYLPAAYVLSGLLGYLFSVIFVIIQKRIKFYNLLVGTLLFVVFITSLFVVGFKIFDKPEWLIFIVFISVGPIFSLINVSFWSLATSLFDLRAGKRLFGVIGSGSVISSILGYFSIPLVLLVLGKDTSNLMVIGNIGLLIGIGFQLITMKQIPESKEIHKAPKNKKSKESSLSLREIFRTKYFRYIFLVVVLSMVVEYFVDYNFMNLARLSMVSEIQLTSFFGVYYGLVKFVELLFRTLAAGRLMNKYGMILGLLLLPVLLFSFILIAIGGNMLTTGLSFLFLIYALIKLIDKVIRRSFEEPAVKTLYQPVDAKSKMLLQTSMEGKGKQLAVMIAGILLMIFNLIPNLTIVAVAIITIGIIIAWLSYAKKTYNEYRIILNEQLTLSSHTKEDLHLEDNDTYFSRGMTPENHNTFIRSITAIHNMKPDVLISDLPGIIHHPDDTIRILSSKWLLNKPILSLVKNLETQLNDEVNPENTNLLNEAILKAVEISNLEDDQVLNLLRSDYEDDRIKSAAWICHYQKEEFSEFLDTLLKDKSSNVVEATCYYISAIKDQKFLKSMFDHLVEHKSYEHAVLKNLIFNSSKSEELLHLSFNEFKGKDRFVLLEGAFNELKHQPLGLIRIIHKLGNLNIEEPIEFLKEKMNFGNWGVQYFVLKSLRQLGYEADENDLPVFRQLILKETSFCTWILASVKDLKRRQEYPELIDSLEEQLAASKAKILNILSFLYPKEAIENIEANIFSHELEKEVMALEMVDILLDEIHKDIVFPLFDKISVSEKIKKLSQHFPQALLDETQRLKNIAFYDYALLNNITKAFALKALNSNSKVVPYEITAQIYGKDQLLKEVAYAEIYNHDEALFNTYIGRESEFTKLQLIKALTDFEVNKDVLSRLDIVHLLKELPLFKFLPYWKISLFDSFFNPVLLKTNHTVGNGYLKKNEFHIFIKGSAYSYDQRGEKAMLQHGVLIGFYDESIIERNLVVEEDSLLLACSKDNFYQILEGFPEVCEKLYHSYVAEEEVTEEELVDNEDLFVDYM